MPNPLILGHRGSSLIAPENTLAAFIQSILAGADGVEFDVRLAADKVPVVIHDDSLRRTANLDRSVRDLTSSELQALDAGAWFYKKHPGSREEHNERVPSLEQVFELYAGKPGVLYVEMKGEPVERELVRSVVRTISEFAFIDRVVVESFDLPAIGELKQTAPEIRTAALFDRSWSTRVSQRGREKILRLAKEVMADEVALHHSLVSSDLVEQLHTNGFATVVWTVDSPDWKQRAATLGMKALITNNPANFLSPTA